MSEELKWFVRWSNYYKGWEVMNGNFRDSWYESQSLAKKRRDELNNPELIKESVCSSLMR